MYFLGVLYQIVIKRYMDWFLPKVVLGKSVAEVAQNVIKHVRLALLTPEELKQVEQENEKDRMIPVRGS